MNKWTELAKSFVMRGVQEREGKKKNVNKEQENSTKRVK